MFLGVSDFDAFLSRAEIGVLGVTGFGWFKVEGYVFSEN